jgi:hypothetical protein
LPKEIAAVSATSNHVRFWHECEMRECPLLRRS